MDERNPRLKARFTTDGEGRFAFRTIQPGPYPNQGPPAHIHLEVTPPGGRTERFELVFEGDARLSHNIREDARTRGFYQICAPVNGPDGVLFCRDVTFRLHQ
jgi:protocatechuate 3,4-dioxygenase beta subunit